MLSRAQQILIKRAQHQAGIDDGEYRDLLQAFGGVRSSTDPKLGDEHLDKILAFMEACYWSGLDKGQLPPPAKIHNPVFRVRGYWAGKNTSQSNSRDRFHSARVSGSVEQLEAEMHRLGYGPQYCESIRRKVCTGGRGDVQIYAAALRRTLAARRRATS